MTRYSLEFPFNTVLHQLASSLEMPAAAPKSNLSKTVTRLFFFNDVPGVLTYIALK